MTAPRVALVTGASSGIGAATARALHGLGFRVALLARRAERLQALAAELDPSGDTVLVAACDLRSEPDILAAWGAVRERWGGVDVLVNNAGLGRDAPLRGGATEAWREMLDVNVLALCICTREALADMEGRGTGHVVHISSMAGHRVPPSGGVYSATKYAVRSLTEGLRKELRAVGSPIRVTSISPGVVETQFRAVYGQLDPETPGLYDAVAMTSEDVAASVVHAVRAPPGVEIHDILMRPTHQAV